MDDVTIWEGDCLVRMREIADGSVSLIATDPPYFRVQMDEDWDRQWTTPDAFLSWIGELCREWRRVLTPNGSLYVFASPSMAARVECKIGETFEVLNSIVWNKLHDYKLGDQRATAYKVRDHESFRRYFDFSERIIFAGHFGSDGQAKGEAGYESKSDELRGFVFEPLRVYLSDERDRAGWTTRRVAEEFQKKTGSRTVTGMAGHWFERVQWELPTAVNYEWLRRLFGGEYLRREYEDLRYEYKYLLRDYQDLRREYEDLRRPFCVDDSVPYTDVWDFPTVFAYPGKHPCEKPLAMMEHIVGVSSRPGDLVLDCFAGSGVTGRACRNLGRRCVLIEKDEHWAKAASLWLDRPHAYLPREKVAKPMPLFAGIEVD